ncbi:hypothetical protein EJ07DRAFT_152352 [Lizonia empirigonia]|nr:hypothetical protein EJ07DRAFT_152352 [Lizonia empirigonia]
MTPKSQTVAARRGRPAKVSAPEPAVPVAAMATSGPSKKRGRPVKEDIVETVTAELPKKRSRPSIAKSDEPIAQIDSAIKRGRRSLVAAEEAVAEAQAPKKRQGRPLKATNNAVSAEAVAPKNRAGRPRKEVVAPEGPATPKRGRRPALDLNRTAGSPRVTRRTSPRSKPVAKAFKVALAPRINPKMRSRLRQRTSSVKKVEQEAAQPAKKARGKPRKTEVEAPAPKKTTGRKATAPVLAASPAKVTARPKTAAPRKRRGYTTFEVPDKFAAQVKQLVADLHAEAAANAAASAGEADDEGEEVEIEIELGPDDGSAPGLLNGASAELADADVEESEDDAMPLDHAEVAHAAALDQEHLDQEEHLAREEDVSSDLAPDNMDIEDETELPSETAVLAEIAAVQDELDVQDAIQDDVQMGGIEQPAHESSSDVSIDVHQEITEVSEIPQIDGSNEINVFHAHVDKHAHVHEHAPATEPAAGSAVGSLFRGL